MVSGNTEAVVRSKACIHINVDGKLIGKGRPRFGKGRTYTPAKTRAAELSLAWEAKEAMKGRLPFKRPVKLFVNVLVARPKSWSEKRIGEASPYYTGKPDADNQLKLVGDALNGIVWEDDSQIAAIDFMRQWWPNDQVHIRVEEI